MLHPTTVGKDPTGKSTAAGYGVFCTIGRADISFAWLFSSIPGVLNCGLHTLEWGWRVQRPFLESRQDPHGTNG